MKNSTAQSNPASREKRNLGFAPIRRGLREHLPSMSSNAVKLYLWLHLSAYWSGPKRGCVEAHYGDVMLGLGWYRKLVQRSIWELAGKGYIQVTPAANQHGITLIEILKFDVGECDSGEDTSVPSKNSAQDTAQDSARYPGVPTSVLSKPAISQTAQDLQAPKKSIEGKKEKKGKADAVRRPVDAEHRIASRKSFSPSERRIKLEKRLTDKIQKNNNANDDELFNEEREAFAYIEYGVRDPRGLACGFVFVVGDVYYDHKKELPPPGILCSKIIDRCMSEQKSCRTLGSDPSEYFWPPDFQEHRDRLRERERLAEKVRP